MGGWIDCCDWPARRLIISMLMWCAADVSALCIMSKSRFETLFFCKLKLPLNSVGRYVQRLASGSANDSRVVQGVVFSKNVVHKRMRTRIAAPRLLLISCAIDFARQVNKVSSLDQLLQQVRCDAAFHRQHWSPA